MILETKDKLLLACIAVCLVLGIVIGKGCSDRPESHRDDKASVDSTIQASARAMDSANKKVEAINKENDRLARYAAGMAAEKEKWQRRAADADDSAEFYATRYQIAIGVKDTALALASCDSLVNEYQEYKLATVETIGAADSIIRAKDDLNANLRMTMALRDDQVKALTRSQQALGNQYADLFKDYKKERRKDNWFNKVGKPVLGVIAGGTIVYLIKK